MSNAVDYEFMGAPVASRPGSLVPCPERLCFAPAEVTDRYMLPSTDGPVVHVRLTCYAGHNFNADAGSLLPAERRGTR